MADRRGLRLLAAGVVLGALTLTACASPELPEEGFVGSEVSPAWHAPETALQTADGSPYSLAEDARKPVTLVFFGYTNCPDICSTVLANVTQALTRVPSATDDVDLVFVTTDPRRDDDQALTRYLGAFDPDYVGLTGPMARIEEFAAGFHIFFERGETMPGGGYEMLHDDNVFVVTDDGAIPLFWRRTLSPAEMAHDLTRLLGED